ncbi:hypothetical protein C2E31_19470 [Rhodopirellula baltica]|nr:hypothetical protein C2E31_19470 [Rhodopirellula baltica]
MRLIWATFNGKAAHVHGGLRKRIMSPNEKFTRSSVENVFRFQWESANGDKVSNCDFSAQCSAQFHDDRQW